MENTISSDYMKFGDVSYAQDIIPVDSAGKPEKLVPMTGFLDLFKKSESNSSNVYINGKKNDLSVVQLPAEEYYKKLVDKQLDSSTLYVLSSDNVNAYGQAITNVGTPVEDDDAATKAYVDGKVAAIREKASKLTKLDVNNVTSVKVLETVNSIIDVLKSI